jgi:LPS sulfotransferase NodH
MVRALRVGWAAAGGVGLSEADVVAAFFPDLTYVHLSCEDQARQALRWYAVTHPGSDSRCVPDYQEVRWLETLVSRYERSSQAHFRLHALAPISVRYEDLRERPGALQHIVSSLGLQGAVEVPWPPAPDVEEMVETWHGPYSEVRSELSRKVGDRAAGR